MPVWKTPDGIEIHYELYGEQINHKVLVLMNGIMGSMQSHWRQFVDPLTADYTVLTFDYRGHGRSEHSGSRLVLEDLVNDFVGLLDHLRLESVFVSGYSIGGYIALQTAMQFPRRIKTLHMHSTKPTWSQDSLDRVRPQLDPDLLSRNAPNYATHLAQEHGASRWRALARESFDLIAYISENRLPDQYLGQVKIPVLVSVGDRDEVVSIPDAARLVFRLPNAGLLVLPQTRRPLPTVELIPLLPMMQRLHHS
ncbi:MAG: alpha/beta hydrolase [Ardenticatenaceae bacterium]|nr:alpha/beta hydrolase [Ardenticatenaceae bacterium]